MGFLCDIVVSFCTTPALEDAPRGTPASNDYDRVVRRWPTVTHSTAIFTMGEHTKRILHGARSRLVADWPGQHVAPQSDRRPDTQNTCA